MFGSNVKIIMFCAMLFLVFSGINGGENFIESVKLEKATMTDIVNLLRRQYGWNVIVADKEEIEQLPPVTLSFNRVPVWVLVRYACMTVGWKYRIEDEIITIGRNVVRSKVYYPAEFKERSVLEDIPWGNRMFIGNVYSLPVNYLPPQVVVNGNGNTVSIISPMPVFGQYVSGVGMQVGSPDSKPAKSYKPAKHTQRLLPEPPEEKLEDELNSRHFPLTLSKLQELKVNLDIEQMPIPEALNTIRRLSLAADRDKEGINIFLKPFPGMEELTVDMIMNKTSLYKVLQYLCESSGLKFHASPYTVVIYKPDAPSQK
jgi:hypothetical protein